MKKIVKKILKRFGFEIIRRRPGQINFQSLLSLLFYKNPEDFFFVQVGANDGKKNDPIYDFVVKYRLAGLLIEPQKDALELSKQNYRDSHRLIFENVAIGHSEGHQMLYTVKRSFRDMYAKHTKSSGSLMASFSKDHVRRFVQRGMEDFFKDKRVDDYIEEIKVSTVSFDALMRKHGIASIDLLQIDTEGFDFEIIKMIDFDRYSPKLINYENAHLGASDRDQCEAFLRGKGYLLMTNKGDTCAIKI